MKKKLIKIANKMIELEQKCQRGENLAENMAEMEQIALTLSEEELFEVDDYIVRKLNNN